MLLVHVRSVTTCCLLALSLLDNRPWILLRFQCSFFTLAHLKLWVASRRPLRIDASIYKLVSLSWRQVMGWLHVVIWAYLSTISQALLRHLVVRCRVLRASISLRRSWSLHLASLLRLDSFTLLPDCSSMRATMSLPNSPYGQVVNLLWIQISLIKYEFVFLVQLFIHGFIMMIDVKWSQIILEKIVSLACLWVIDSHISVICLSYQILVPLRPDWYGLWGRLCHWIYTVSVFFLNVWKAILSVSGIEPWGWRVSEIFRLWRFARVYRIMGITHVNILS